MKLKITFEVDVPDGWLITTDDEGNPCVRMPDRNAVLDARLYYPNPCFNGEDESFYAWEFDTYDDSRFTASIEDITP